MLSVYLKGVSSVVRYTRSNCRISSPTLITTFLTPVLKKILWIMPCECTSYYWTKIIILITKFKCNGWTKLNTTAPSPPLDITRSLWTMQNKQKDWHLSAINLKRKLVDFSSGVLKGTCNEFFSFYVLT